MTYTFDSQIVSDLHKDAFGYRPTADFWDMWNNGLSDEGRQAEWDYMIKALKSSIDEEKLREQYDLEAFESQLGIIMNAHNIDEKSALEILTYSENNVGHMSNSQDIEHWVWGHGILFTPRGKEIVKILKEIYKVKY
jgi:hypothetical protein